jgi:hypothetical protein
MSDFKSLADQKHILALRNQWIAAAASAQDKLKAEETAFSILRDASSEKLAPVLIQRNNAELIAAYLVQRIGANSWRFLLTGAEWQLLRARKSAKLLRVPEKMFEAFKNAVVLQAALSAGIEEIEQAILKEGKHAGTGQVKHAPKKQSGVHKSRPAVIKRQA